MYYSIRKSWNIEHRQDDIPVIREVYHGNQYHNGKIGFGIESGDHWIDIGAHIGCFSKKVIYQNATVSAYEPDLKNYELLVKNIGTSNAFNFAVSHESGKASLKKGSASYFSKIIPGDDITVLSFEAILIDDCCVKMDIEGSEMTILDNCDFSKISKFVFAYHTNVDKSKSNFLNRMNRLKTWFNVFHQSIKDDGKPFNQFPNEIIVYCRRNTDQKDIYEWQKRRANVFQ